MGVQTVVKIPLIDIAIICSDSNGFVFIYFYNL